MGFRGLLTTLLASGMALSLSVGPALAQDFRTTWRGSWHCNDRGDVYPLAGARVELWQRGYSEMPKWLTDSRVASKYTDANGAFEFTTVSDDEDDFYLRLLLDDGADVQVKSWWTPWSTWFIDTATNQNDVPVQDFGRLAIREVNGGTPPCAVWQGGREAYADYRAVMGRRPTYGRFTIEADAPSDGTPYALYTTIMWPPRYPPGPLNRMTGLTSPQTVFHEFAHTIRHAYDGGPAHFFDDVVRYNYLQQHKPCDRTNHKFAFNEGWAEYWARQYRTIEPKDGKDFEWKPPSDCPYPATDYAVEGNVAAALGRLEELCRNVERADMVNTLAHAGSSIHSYQEFEEALERREGKCRPRIEGLTFYEPAKPPRVPQISIRRGAIAQVNEFEDKERLARKMLKAVTGTEVVCRKEPCPKRPTALTRAALPPILRADAQVMVLLRKRLAFTTSFRATRKQLGRSPGRTLSRRLRAVERRIARGIAAIEADALRSTMRQAGSLLRADGSAESRLVSQRLAAFTRAFRRGRVPSGYVLPGLTSAEVAAAPASALRR
jgi:hypothetical protein